MANGEYRPDPGVLDAVASDTDRLKFDVWDGPVCGGCEQHMQGEWGRQSRMGCHTGSHKAAMRCRWF